SGILMDSGSEPWGKHGTDGFWEKTVSIAKRQHIRHKILDLETLKSRFPAFQVEPSGKVYWEEEAGFLRPEVAIRAQLDLAQKNEAEILVNIPVEGIRKEGDSILILTKDRQISAEKVLISAGGWIRDFLQEEEKSKFKICRQVLHWLEIEPGFTDWTAYPVWMWGFGPKPEDFIYGFPSLDGRTVKMASESFVDLKHPDFLNREVNPEEQDQFWKEKVEGKILGLKPNVVKSVVCFYTVTSDARFVVKPLAEMDNVLLASACSGHGFKHSAALGERLALELLGKH
ncbi:MAG TPA: FAD-dependent oxidoreductase, partial [Algoriphagus sp.]|nr:FAD-dependent oxidoreductase [Algoriphagus sp.]